MLPTDQKEALTALFDEFEAYETAESRFAHSLDNLQPLLLKLLLSQQLSNYYKITRKKYWSLRLQTE
jgi:putative hydrolase of HD superfamily